MKFVSEEEYKKVMTENEDNFGSYDKVNFIVKLNNKMQELSGIRAIDNKDVEHFFTNTQNKGIVGFSAEEVLNFDRVGEGNYHIPDNVKSDDPSTSLQKAIAQKLADDQKKTIKENKAISTTLINELGYFPVLKSANIIEIVIDFYDKDQNMMDSLYFPLTKGEEYEIYSHDDERDIPMSALVVDVKGALDANGDPASEMLFAKYYETYNVLQDLEFLVDNEYTKEIFNNYKLNEKFSKVIGDISKHDLLSLVQEYNDDVAIQQAGKELRIQHGLIKPETKHKIKP
jgi:hypothetical protein